MGLGVNFIQTYNLLKKREVKCKTYTGGTHLFNMWNNNNNNLCGNNFTENKCKDINMKAAEVVKN